MNHLENLQRVLRHDHPGWVPNGLGMALREIGFATVEWPEQAGLDAWGVGWDMVDPELGAYPVTHPLQSLDDVDDLPMPDFSTAPYSEKAQAWMAADDRADFWLMGRVGETLFERAWMLLGMENLMIGLFENPDGVRRLFRRIADARAAMIARHHAAGCEAVIFADDYGGQDNLLMSPDAWRALIRPELARLYAMCRDAGLLIVHHSCGRIEGIIPDLVEMGLNVWHPCQPVNDLAALKQRFAGRLTFYGAVNSAILARGTTDEVRAEVRLRVRELAAGGGYVAAPSHGVPFLPENLAAMDDELRRVGGYGSPEYAALFEGESR